jgi:hypothetical protein
MFVYELSFKFSSKVFNISSVFSLKSVFNFDNISQLILVSVIFELVFNISKSVSFKIIELYQVITEILFSPDIFIAEIEFIISLLL